MYQTTVRAWGTLGRVREEREGEWLLLTRPKTRTLNTREERAMQTSPGKAVLKAEGLASTKALGRKRRGLSGNSGLTDASMRRGHGWRRGQQWGRTQRA